MNIYTKHHVFYYLHGTCAFLMLLTVNRLYLVCCKFHISSTLTRIFHVFSIKLISPYLIFTHSCKFIMSVELLRMQLRCYYIHAHTCARPSSIEKCSLLYITKGPQFQMPKASGWILLLVSVYWLSLLCCVITVDSKFKEFPLRKLQTGILPRWKCLLSENSLKTQRTGAFNLNFCCSFDKFNSVESLVVHICISKCKIISERNCHFQFLILICTHYEFFPK